MALLDTLLPRRRVGRFGWLDSLAARGYGRVSEPQETAIPGENCRPEGLFPEFWGVLCVFPVAIPRKVFLIIASLKRTDVLVTPETPQGGLEAMAKAPAKKPLSKSQVLATLAETSGLPKKEVGAVLDALVAEIKKNLGGRGPGVFTIPGLIKIDKRKVPARPAQKGVLNRLTGKIEDRPAKPASVKVRVRALKGLKDMIKTA